MSVWWTANASFPSRVASMAGGGNRRRGRPPTENSRAEGGGGGGGGAGVPWWRVVRADGRPVRGLEEQALELLRRDGTPLRDARVDMRAARVRPSADPE